MSTRRKTTRQSARNGSLPLDLQSYWQDSLRPLTILTFLLPFVALYELGARLFHTEVVAFSLLRLLAGWFGVYGRGVPAALLVLSLLAWHLVRQYPWRVHVSTLAGMAIESLFWAMPVFLISLLCRRYLPLSASSPAPLGALWSLSFGAGVYEELVFRFYGCGALRFVAEYLLKIREPLSMILVVLVSSVLFSLYHYLGDERFAVGTFLFRTVAGAYFATLFLKRGLGVTAGAHATYDIIVVALLRS